MGNKILFLAAIALVLQSRPIGANSAHEGAALIIGDGVSVEMLSVGRVFLKGATGRLELEKLPHSAFVSTWSKNSMVTDSSAAGTTFARGFKAVNGRVGIRDAEGDTGPSLLDIAKTAGWVTVVITDDSVTGGTPSPFMVEHISRNEHAAIAGKMIPALGARADLVLGGGRAWFEEREGFRYPPDAAEQARRNGEALKASAAQVFTDWDAFSGALETLDLTKRPVLGLFADDTLAYLATGEKRPKLGDMIRAVLSVMERIDQPCLLVIEAGLPDKAAHMNEGRYALTEISELDDAVMAVDGWLSKDSPVLVTTDHGTGGMALNGYLPLKSSPDALLRPNPASGLPVVSWATGPGGLPPEGAKAPETDSDKPNAVQKAAAYAGSAMHTGGDVWGLGRGRGSERVSGFIDNTEFFAILKDDIEARSAKAAAPAAQ